MTEVVLEQKPQMAAISAFGKRNANKEKIEQEEAELKKLMDKGSDENKDEEGTGVDDANLSAEERTFKKRYGDLRRHSQQQQTQLQSQIDELKAQLQKSTENQIKLPKSEEELAEWAKQYPDVAKIVESIAIKKAREQAEEIDKRLKSLDEREQQNAKEKAEVELMKLHPDFNSIRDDDAFHDWVEAQPKWIQQALYENDTDYIAAGRAIDLYKADMAKTKKSSRNDNRDAAQSIGTRSGRSAPAGEDTDGVFYESQVDKMTPQQYEASVEAIQKAIKAGKFVYDLSGSAR